MEPLTFPCQIHQVDVWVLPTAGVGARNAALRDEPAVWGPIRGKLDISFRNSFRKTFRNHTLLQTQHRQHRRPAISLPVDNPLCVGAEDRRIGRRRQCRHATCNASRDFHCPEVKRAVVLVKNGHDRKTAVSRQANLIETAQYTSHRGEFVAVPIDPHQLRAVRVIEPDQSSPRHRRLDRSGRPEVWDVRRNGKGPLGCQAAGPGVALHWKRRFWDCPSIYCTGIVEA
jgi:hypothetical protein